MDNQYASDIEQTVFKYMYMKDRDGEISCAYIGSKLKILID